MSKDDQTFYELTLLEEIRTLLSETLLVQARIYDKIYPHDDEQTYKIAEEICNDSYQRVLKAYGPTVDKSEATVEPSSIPVKADPLLYDAAPGSRLSKKDRLAKKRAEERIKQKRNERP